MMTSVAIKLFFDSLVSCTGRKSNNIIRFMFVRKTSNVMNAGATDKLNVCFAVYFDYLKFIDLYAVGTTADII